MQKGSHDIGKVSLKNLRRVARELNENLSDDELQAMIDEFDKDGDGQSTSTTSTRFILLVNEEEFLAIMMQSTIY